jgi:hypothetical protein
MENKNESLHKSTDGAGRAVPFMRCVSALSHEAGEAKIYFYGMICL